MTNEEILDLAKGFLTNPDALKKDILSKALVTLGFNDGKISVDRWGNVKMSSPSINSIADDCDFGHSCGCCSGAALYVYVFKNINGFRIYSSPDHFCIGKGNEYGFGEIPNYNWERTLKDNNIPETIIKKVSKFLEDNPEINETESEVDSDE